MAIADDIAQLLHWDFDYMTVTQLNKREPGLQTISGLRFSFECVKRFPIVVSFCALHSQAFIEFSTAAFKE